MTTSCANRIKELRIKRAWSQDHLATIAGVNVRTVQRIEAGDPASLDTLKALANAFDSDVSNLVQPRLAAPTAPDSILLIRVRTGRDLFKIAAGAEGFGLDHGELDDEAVELVATFLQDLKDCAEMWNDLEPAERVRVPHEFTSRIQEIEDAGLNVFAMRHPHPYKVAGRTMPLDTATVYVVKSTDPGIMSLADDGTILPRRTGS